MSYKKFRGRGKGAFEKAIGADGIVQIEVDSPEGISRTKGVLFQAKKNVQGFDAVLQGQVTAMEALGKGVSAVFIYRRDGYRAAAGSELLLKHETGESVDHGSYHSLGNYLAEQFLECRSGQRGMYFDALRRMLILPSLEDPTVVAAEIGHRILVEVEAN